MFKVILLIFFCITSHYLLAQDTIAADSTLTSSNIVYYKNLSKELCTAAFYLLGLFLSIITFAFLISLYLCKKPSFLYQILRAIHHRITHGSQFSVPGFQFGKAEQGLITQTEDIKSKKEQYGNPDNFRLLFKVKIQDSNGILTKSTKAMAVLGGCVLQVTTEFINNQGQVTVAEALTFVPNAKIERDFSEATGYRLVNQ